MVKGKGSQQPQQGAKPSQVGPKKPVYPTLQHADLYQRAIFTLQASAFLQQLHREPSSSDRKGKRKALANEVDIEADDSPDTSRLARNMMLANGRIVVHNQLKLDPSAKRNTCRKCSTVLIPGLTAKIRNRPNKNHMNVTNTTCTPCGAQHTIPQPPTSISGEILDGPKRAKRRRGLADRRKIPFHQREAVPPIPDGSGAANSSTGHTLWQAGKTIHRWSESTLDKNPVQEGETAL